MTIPRPVALALAGLVLTASLTGCGGPSAPVAAPTKPASVAPRPRPTIDTSWMERQQRESEQRQRDADQKMREADMRREFDRKLKESEARSRCLADNANKNFPSFCP